MTTRKERLAQLLTRQRRFQPGFERPRPLRQTPDQRLSHGIVAGGARQVAQAANSDTIRTAASITICHSTSAVHF